MEGIIWGAKPMTTIGSLSPKTQGVDGFAESQEALVTIPLRKSCSAFLLNFSKVLVAL